MWIEEWRQFNNENELKYWKELAQAMQATNNDVSPTGFVYFVYEEGNQCFFKIGYTTQDSVEDRLKTLQTGNRRKLIIYKKIETNNASCLEQEIHHIFSHERVRGEWFNIDVQDIDNLFN
jgi:hypothetical protein